MPQCNLAKAAENTGTTPEDWYDVPSRAAAQALGFASKSTVNDLRNAHKAGACKCHAEVHKVHTDTHNRRDQLELGPDGGNLTYHTTDPEPIRDWDDVLVHLGADPERWTVASDTVRVSRWQQSSKEDGERDLVWLTAYKAEIRPKAHEDDTRLNDLINHVRGFTPSKREAVTGDPVTLVVALADLQLGKGEGDGTPGTIKRLTNALSGVRDYVEHRRAEGHNIERILLANMGDHIEAVQGSYASQPATVDLNLRDQLSLALELNMQWITAMSEYAPVTYSATLCNHGSWQRAGHDSVMGDADNATGFIGDQLRTVCKHVPGLDIEFNIPRDELLTKQHVSGVNLVMSHGHKISGNEATWLATQSQALTHRERFIPDLWLTAHKHHAQITDYGPYTRIQATTVDPGSKWLYDAKGVYSTPGVTVFLAGAHLPMKYDNHRVIV